MIVELIDVKNYLKIDSLETGYDGLLTGFIQSSEQEINSICNQHIVKALFTENFIGAGATTKLLHNYPITDITVIQSRVVPVGSYTVLATTNYELFEMNSNYFVYNLNFFSAGSYYQIAYNSGYLSTVIPKAIQQVATEMVAIKFKESSGRLGLSQDNESLQGVSLNKVFKDLDSKWRERLSPYRIPTGYENLSPLLNQ